MAGIVEISGGIDVCGKPLKTRFKTVFLLTRFFFSRRRYKLGQQLKLYTRLILASRPNIFTCERNSPMASCVNEFFSKSETNSASIKQSLHVSPDKSSSIPSDCLMSRIFLMYLRVSGFLLHDKSWLFCPFTSASKKRSSVEFLGSVNLMFLI